MFVCTTEGVVIVVDVGVIVFGKELPTVPVAWHSQGDMAEHVEPAGQQRSTLEHVTERTLHGPPQMGVFWSYSQGSVLGQHPTPSGQGVSVASTQTSCRRRS